MAATAPFPPDAATPPITILTSWVASADRNEPADLRDQTGRSMLAGGVLNHFGPASVM